MKEWIYKRGSWVTDNLRTFGTNELTDATVSRCSCTILSGRFSAVPCYIHRSLIRLTQLKTFFHAATAYPADGDGPRNGFVITESRHTIRSLIFSETPCSNSTNQVIRLAEENGLDTRKACSHRPQSYQYDIDKLAARSIQRQRSRRHYHRRRQCLGLYAARALDANGAKAVYIVGRREETLQQAAKTGVNGTIIPLQGDVTDKTSLQGIAERVRKEQGYVNLVFANAGIGGPWHASALPQDRKPTLQEVQKVLFDPSMEDFTKTQHFNNTATFYTVIAFLDLLDAGNQNRNVPQDSQVIVTSSIAGFSRHLANSFAYSTSKAAVTHLVKMLSTFFAQNKFHIRANVIAPGLYPSELTEGQTSKLGEFSLEGHHGVFAGARTMASDRSPAERTGSEEDFAGLFLFLASRADANINGEALLTDGGRISQLPAVY